MNQNYGNYDPVILLPVITQGNFDWIPAFANKRVPESLWDTFFNCL
jgi:hypothetical protein